MTEQQAIEAINEECHTRDIECDHALADKIIMDFLTDLGHTELVKAWEDVEKWYA